MGLYLADLSPVSLDAVAKLDRDPGDVLMVLVAERDRPDLPRLIDSLRDHDISFFGGLFPALIHGDRRKDGGMIVQSLPAMAAPHLITSLHTDDVRIPDFHGTVAHCAGKKYTAIILIDGLTSNICFFLSELFSRLGNSVHYFGGGAGSLSLEQGPCVFTNEGIFQDAAVVSFVKLQSQLGVRHGWKQLVGPLVATKTDHNVIVELNWRNAFDVYRETVERDAESMLTRDNFFSIAKGYPFGIYREGEEDIVRDPISVTEAGELVCVGEVPENTVLNILKGERESLIEAAGQSARESHGPPNRTLRHRLVADCISRALFLEADFERELSTVMDGGETAGLPVPEGVLTLGEISSYGRGFIEFFNKTIVTGGFYE